MEIEPFLAGFLGSSALTSALRLAGRAWTQSQLPIGAVTSDQPWRSQLGEGPDHQLSVIEYPVMEVDSVTSAIKRRVKDGIPKTKLNASLASKIKTRIKKPILLFSRSF